MRIFFVIIKGPNLLVETLLNPSQSAVCLNRTFSALVRSLVRWFLSSPVIVTPNYSFFSVMDAYNLSLVFKFLDENFSIFNLLV